MNEAVLHSYLTWGLLGLALLTFVSLLFITAPYGRHYDNKGWGPDIPSRVGWVLMESPAVFFFAFVYFRGQHALSAVPLVLLGLWQWHYLHRTFVFPFRMRMGGKSMPLLIAVMGIGFNLLNAYINARFISELGRYGQDWLADPRFLLGGALFFTGFVMNVHSDTILRNLRRDGDKDYHIPYGGAYRFVSCPNYLGELLEWLGWALATWSLGGLAFFIYTAANLVPRARSHHRWYKEKFSDYPSERKAIIPGIY